MKVQSRPGGAWETSRKRGLYRRLTLRRADGQVYLNRWGIGHDRVGGVLLHRMDAPDPGIDLHDHPWWFVSVILSGGYVEQRTIVEAAPPLAALAERGRVKFRGAVRYRKPGSVKLMHKGECHTITGLLARRSWSLIIRGPRRRDRLGERSDWGFYLSSGYLPEADYDETVRAQRRDLWSDENATNRPWTA